MLKEILSTPRSGSTSFAASFDYRTWDNVSELHPQHGEEGPSISSVCDNLGRASRTMNPEHLSPTVILKGQVRERRPAEDRGLFRLLRIFDRSPLPLVSAICGVLILGIGYLSYRTGPQLSCSLLFLIPVLVVSRAGGLLPGGLAAIGAAATWLVADLAGGLDQGHPVTPYWNAVMRLGTFLIAVGLVSAMKSLNAHLEERVRERTAALETQIAEKRELEKNILAISDRERAIIGLDLHDGLCQQLVSAAFSANLLHEELVKEATAAAPRAGRIADLIDDAITQARNLARGLYPVRLETEGLETALQELAATLDRRFGIACSVECHGSFAPFDPETGIHLYRIAQEAVVNAAKHSGAKSVVVRLGAHPDGGRLAIEDDGSGIRREAVNREGMGLRIMEYRARMIGARFRIEKRSGGGTRVVCEYPL
jgi:signal transduction histidine kinase